MSDLCPWACGLPRHPDVNLDHGCKEALQAEVERLRADMSAGLGPEETVFVTNENEALRAEVERLLARCERQRSIIEGCPVCVAAMLEPDEEWPLAKLRAEVERLREVVHWLRAVLDVVDYTAKACSLTEMVGAVLDERVIKGARAALAAAQPKE